MNWYDDVISTLNSVRASDDSSGAAESWWNRTSQPITCEFTTTDGTRTTGTLLGWGRFDNVAVPVYTPNLPDEESKIMYATNTREHSDILSRDRDFKGDVPDYDNKLASLLGGE